MSAVTRNQVFTAVHTVGGLLPADMLVRISEGKDVPGSKPADYGLPSSRSVRDEAERSWEYLKPLWRDLRKHLPEDRETGLPASDSTGRAGSDWLAPLWRELGFGPLTHVGAAGIIADSDAEKRFPVSHRWRHALIHQTAWNADLDKRPGGAGSVPPQSMLQECLNRTEAHLWGVLTNGRQVRLLRDSSALATASYVEFDLEAIFDGELFSEFVLLYRVLHVSRFEVAEDAPPSACRLEKWRTEAIASGTRALDQLRKGVQDAITALGTGFLRHPENTALREDVRPKALQAALLRLVYRLLFVFVAEDRDALLSPKADPQARERYEAYFSSARLRAHARKRRGTAHGDLYEALRIVLDALGDEKGRPELGLPGLGGLFNDTEADVPLRGLKLSNEALLTAVRHLSQVRDGSSGRWRAVDYRHLDAEELGSVYESLLELEPKHSTADRTFTLVEVAGNTRKTTGSYYTPSSLIECLLDSTLDPVIRDAVKRGEEAASKSGATDPADAIVNELLSLTVCDPACGSGHFLVASARRIAKQVAAVRERNPEPTLDAVRHALHEVVARCIYGVDLNPMAVELAKVSLWLEALEPGKPLGFLDAHVKHGNALIGATPALLRGGIPDAAFKPVEGDDTKFAKALERQNKLERGGQRGLFDLHTEVKVTNTAFAMGLRHITSASPDTLADVNWQEAAYNDWSQSSQYIHALHVADAWCAAFMWRKKPDAPLAITEEVFRNLQDPMTDAASKSTHDEIIHMRRQYNFFHWHLEFPEIFEVSETAETDVDPSAGWTGGFSCVLGNPPWDKVDFKDQEYFSMVEPSIAALSGSARRARISQWVTEHFEEGQQYSAARRHVKSCFLFLGQSGAYPLLGKGLSLKGVNSLQVDQLFTERFTSITAPNGRCGMIIPTQIATGAGAQYLFQDLTHRAAISHLYDFENGQKAKLFPAVHSSYQFSLLSLTGRKIQVPASQLAFFLGATTDLDDIARVFELAPDEIALINPNTGNLPVFRTRRDANLTVSIYRRISTLWNRRIENGNPWGLDFKNLFNMTDDSHLFHTREQLEGQGWTLAGNVFIRGAKRMLPLYEAKMLHHYDHRWATYDEDGSTRDCTVTEKQDLKAVALPRYWVAEDEVTNALADSAWSRNYLLGLRKICRATDERTAIASVFPIGGLGHSGTLLMPLAEESAGLLYVNATSLVLDYVLRQKLGGTNLNNFQFEQLPFLKPGDLNKHRDFITCRAVELTYTTIDMKGFADDLGEDGAPFYWDVYRRQVIRAELDALFFHLYGISREDADYVLDTFPIVRRKDEAKYGSYRTKQLILTEYDRMAEAGLTLDNPLVDGENYTSTLTPPPGHGPRHPA
ncbi:Eco57I restriction-modification methylase domain-containing protein [Streptomyces bobili]